MYHHFYHMWFFTTIIIIVLIFLVYFLYRYKQKIGKVSKESPLEMLKKRYAKGEISKEQFHDIKKDIILHVVLSNSSI